MRTRILHDRWLLQNVALLTALVLSTACGSDPGGEPNDSIDEAGSASLGEPFTLTIEPEGDRDWFAVEAPGPGYLDVSAGSVPEGIDLEVAFARHQKWEAEKENWLRGWEDTPVAVGVPEAGTYHVAVRDAHDDGESGEPIELRIDFLEPFDPQEPNVTPEEAVEQKLDAVVTVAVFPRGDRDWFRVEAPESGYLEVQTRDVPDGIEPEVLFSQLDEWSGERTDLRGWSKVPAAVFLPEAGTYHVALHDDYDDARSRETFEVRFRWIESMDPGEPNGTHREATPLPSTGPSGGSATMAIFPTGDQDVFRLELAEAGPVRVQASGDADGELSLEASLYRPHPEELGEIQEVVGWTALPVELPAEQAGEHFLMVHDDYDDAASPEPFELRVEAPLADTTEAGMDDSAE